MKNVRAGGAMLWLTVAMCVIAACQRTPDEARVRAAIAAAAEAAENGAAGDVIAPLSDDFDGNSGELDRRALGNLVRLFALRGEHIGVVLGPVSIERRGERLLANMTVTLTGSGRLLPEHAGVYRVQSAWRRENGQWLCYTATWQRAL
jgi:hypothetical protein